MQRLAITFAAIVLCSLSAFTSAQAETYSMEQITRSLQNEYQTQLDRKPRRASTPKRPAKRSTNKISRQTIERILQKPTAKRPPQVRQQPRQAVRRPVAHTQQAEKPPTPHAEDLFDAASSGSVGNISRLLSQGMNVNIANYQRETALHMATAKGHYSAVIYLINHGANIHARTVNNWLPIHHAARFRRAVIAKYLIQRGSSPHARTSDGLSAIDMAKATRDQRLLGLFGVR